MNLKAAIIGLSTFMLLVMIGGALRADPVEIDLLMPGHTGDWARLERVDCGVPHPAADDVKRKFPP